MKKTLLFILFASFFSFETHAFTVEHNFKVVLGVFDASKTTFSYSLNDDNYSVDSFIKTDGLFNNLYPFKATYKTTGKIKNDDLETTSYSYQSKSRFSKRSKELIYNEKGLPIYRISSKNDKQKKVDIKQDINNKDTTDLQTIIAKLAKQFNAVKFCASRMEVFDGKRRFAVIFADEGREQIKANEFSPYAGEATKCSMYIDKLQNDDDDDLLMSISSEKPIYFWIMEEYKTKKPFIAKILIENTSLGKLSVYTQNVKIKE